MSLFPDEDVLTRGFIDKLPSEEDKVIFTRLLDSCYKYAVAINSHDHQFPTEPLIMSFTIVTTQAYLSSESYSRI